MNDTLQYYNERAAAFVADTRDGDMREQYASFLQKVNPGRLILDLGCGSGRDSHYFLQHGYQVCAVDGSLELCRLAEEYLGQKVHHLMFQQLDWQNQFDGVWACASLLHCTNEELPDILQRVADSLKSQGVLYLSFKYGDFSGWRNGRYFTDLTEDRLAKLLKQVPELQLCETFLTGDVRTDRQQEQWLNAIVEKR